MPRLDGHALDHELLVKQQPPESVFRVVFYGQRVLAVYQDGRVWNIKLGRMMQPYIDQDGYRIIGGFIQLHRLVLIAFQGFPKRERGKGKGMVVRHLDGDPGNNNLDNLKWGTQQENWEDRKRHGRINAHAKWDDPAVRERHSEGLRRAHQRRKENG